MERKTNALKRVVTYARVASVEAGKRGKACGEQLRRSSEFAEASGYDVAATFSDEGLSGNCLDRPGLQAMLAFLRDHNEQNYDVVVESTSCLARDLVTHQKLTAELATTGARLIIADNRGGV